MTERGCGIEIIHGGKGAFKDSWSVVKQVIKVAIGQNSYPILLIKQRANVLF